MATPAETLTDALLGAAAAESGRVLLDCGGQTLSIGDLEAGSKRCAHALAGAGIEPGDRVAIMMRNVIDFPSCWLGILRAGAIEVPVHAAYRGPLLEHVLSESAPRLLICDEEFAPRLAELDLPTLERVVIRGDGAAGAGLRHPVLSLEEFLAGAAARPLPVATASTPSCILYTSGTTGRSKGVVLTHSANLRLSRTNVEMMRYGPEDVLYTAFPLFHVNAKFTSLVSALLCGGRLVLDDRFSASGFWPRMREKGVTAFNYMGSLLTILHKAEPRPDDADNPVTRCYGSACPAGIWKDFERRFDLRLNELYGMTEIGIATLNGYGERRVGSIGRAVDYFEVRIGDADDRESAAGEVGEILVRPREPGVMFDYYWDRLDATAEGFRNLWFHTGDRGWRDEDDFFHFADRSKDSVRRRGENVSTFEVENVLNTHPAVLEAAAYGVPSDVSEEELMVAVVRAPGAALEASELLDHCQGQLPYFAVPRYVSFRAEIPKNASQRVQKFKLREEGVTNDAFDAVAAGYVVRR
jgi:crotonobetaine/carnitine-CoA ligase